MNAASTSSREKSAIGDPPTSDSECLGCPLARDARPLVVRLAARVALDALDEHKRPGRLVTRQALGAPVPQRLRLRIGGRCELDDGGDLVAEALTRAADHERVRHIVVS